MVSNNLENYGRRHFKIFTNCHVSWDTLYIPLVSKNLTSHYFNCFIKKKSFSYFDDFSSLVSFQFPLVQCCYINRKPVLWFMFFNGTKNRMDSEKSTDKNTLLLIMKRLSSMQSLKVSSVLKLTFSLESKEDMIIYFNLSKKQKWIFKFSIRDSLMFTYNFKY